MYTHKAYPIYLEESKVNSHTKACEGPLLPKKLPPNIAAAYYVYALRTTDTDAHTPLVDEKLTKYQAGFIPGRSCVGQLPNLTRQHRRRLRKIDDNRAAFVDMSAAYDTVQHRLIIRKLVDIPFTYLGSLITNDGSYSRDITSRIAKAASAMCRLSNPLFRQHRISIRTKINMCRALVVSVLLYGSEAWATTLADRRRLDVFDMRCQRRLLRVFWQQHVSNQSISERTRQPTASSLLRQRCLRWFGHLHRMPSSLLVQRVFDFNPTIHGWKRPRGRPKTRWADSVKHDLHSAGLDSINAAQLVYDRPQWKAFVCGLPTLEPEHGP